jgi:hypothetical protein
MLTRGTFQAGERRVAKVSVGWTNMAEGQPNRWGVLYCTDRHLILTAPRVGPIVLILLWPVLGPVGLIFAGLLGGVAAATLLVAVSFAIPKRIIMRLPLPGASRCTLFPSVGWRRVTTRDVVEITSTDGRAWRLSVLGRDQRSAAPIVRALESAGITVVPASAS